MSATALLSELRKRAIHLRAEGSELRLSAPAGALTPELREELRRYKADLLALLASAQALSVQQRAIVPLQRNGGGVPIFGVPGHNGDVFCYRALARHLGDGQPFYGLQPPGLDGHAEPLASVAELAAYFAAEIRGFQREGPYVIAGFCAGGAIALELARELAAGGAQVGRVALFGCPYPDYFKRRAGMGYRVAEQLGRVAKHGRELARRRGWRERYAYLAAELRERDARLAKARAEALDPVLVRRARVEAATLRAVCAYTPRPYAGRVDLFLPGTAWLRSGAAPLDWRALAAEVEAHFGPDASTGSDMLREPHAAAFAALYRRRYY